MHPGRRRPWTGPAGADTLKACGPEVASGGVAMRSSSVLCAGCLCLVFILPVRGRSPSPEDALPPGAVARLGSLRLWQGGYRICAVALSPDARFVASAGFDAPVVLWETATGRKVRNFGPRQNVF